MFIQHGGLAGNPQDVFKVVLAIIAVLSHISDEQTMFSRTFPITGGCSRFRSLVLICLR